MMKNKVGKLIALVLGITVLLGNNYSIADNSTPGFTAAGLGYIDGFDVIGTQGNQIDSVGQEPRILKTVKNVINRVLGILGLIALILCLRGGFQMLTAAGDDGKVKTGTKILKHAAIGLVIIGLSWLVVTFIFYLINLNADSGTP